MDAKRLRQRILDFAIRGKLVPQDPNDEPASVLLEKIRVEKACLIKEGKIKKNKKADTSDRSHYMKVPFEVPDSWVWTTIGEIFHLQAGKNISASEISESMGENLHPCYGGNGLRGFTKSFNRDGFYPLIGRQGALCGNINSAEGKFYATEHAVIVDIFCDIDINYCIYFLTQLNLNQYATATAQPGLSVNTINEVLIPLPPLSEQKRIIAEIKKWLTMIDSLEINQADLQKAIKQAKLKILDLAICGKLVPQNPNDESASEQLKRINPKAEITCDNPQYKNLFYKLPKNWSWATLGSISNYGFCKNVDIANIEANDWVLELEDIEKDSGKLLRINRKKDRILNGVRHQFPKGCILYSKLRTYLNKVLIPYEDGYCTTEIIPINCSDGILSSYICHVLRSMYFINYTTLQEYGVKMPRLSTDDARKAFIPIPPTKEQIRIVDKINSLYFVLDNIMAEL